MINCLFFKTNTFILLLFNFEAGRLNRLCKTHLMMFSLIFSPLILTFLVLCRFILYIYICSDIMKLNYLVWRRILKNKWNFYSWKSLEKISSKIISLKKCTNINFNSFVFLLFNLYYIYIILFSTKNFPI